MQAYEVTFRDGATGCFNGNSPLDAMLRARVWARATARSNHVATDPDPIPFRRLRAAMTPVSAVLMFPRDWESV